MADKSRRPDFDVTVSRKRPNSDKYINVRVGSAWKRDNGAVSIRIDTGISVATPEDVFLTLWPKKDEDDRKGSDRGQGDRGSRRRDSDRHNYDDGGDRR